MQHKEATAIPNATPVVRRTRLVSCLFKSGLECIYEYLLRQSAAFADREWGVRGGGDGDGGGVFLLVLVCP